MYCEPLPKSHLYIKHSIYTHSVESVEIVFSPSSGPRLTASGSFTESNSEVAGEREGEGGSGLKPQGKKEENETLNQLKRVRKLDDDSSSGEDTLPFQDPPQHSQDRGEESLRQPVKRIRKWIDSDSDCDQDNREGSVGGGDGSEAVEGGGGRREEDEESDSEGEGALAIDLEHQSQSSGGEMEEEREEGIQSPMIDTGELLHKDDEDGNGEIGSEACCHEEIAEQGSLATLAMH